MKYNNNTGIVTNTHFSVDVAAREKFLEAMNVKPEHVTKETGVDTVPISALETTLDEVYLGLWKTDNFRHQVIANEIVGTIDLHVFDPQAKIWITRSGSAAVMIRQKKDAALNDISAKIKNGLMMDFPKLESMCLKAAAKRLGKKFGRDLNRKFEDEYETAYTNEAEFNSIVDKLEGQLRECKTVPELLKVWGEFEVLHDNKHLKKIFNSYKLKLQHGSK